MDTKTNFDDKVDISRSGRVRKKSSKLIDFQSPDEVEKKLKRLPKTIEKRTGAVNRRPTYRTRTGSNISNTFNDDIDDNDSMEDDDDDDDDEDDDEDRQENDDDDVDEDEENIIGDDDYDELDEMVDEIVEGVEAESSFEQENSFNESKVRSSLYMSEKSNKRKILRYGKIINSKVERKDKGKSRYTAYSLWAREFRKTSKFSKNQDLDFSNASRRLSELWANVSNKEKCAWRRKAKIQATKAKCRDRSTLSETTSSPSSFVSRATTTRKLLAVEQQKTPPPLSPPSSSKRKRYNSQRSSSSTSNAAAIDDLNSITNGIGTAFLNSSYLSSTNSSSLSSSQREQQLPSVEAIDAAAHLKLLGESLSIIGERLKEHEGQIALSGSLSVLLDSILCSLGPLMCLTPFIPGLEKKPQLNTNLASTLDNIAYVMPGL